jgi:hypothetical protein
MLEKSGGSNRLFSNGPFPSFSSVAHGNLWINIGECSTNLARSLVSSSSAMATSPSYSARIP